MTSFRLIQFDPRRKTCRAKIEVDGWAIVWQSRQQLKYLSSVFPTDPELLALEHYKSGEAYKVKA